VRLNLAAPAVIVSPDVSPGGVIRPPPGPGGEPCHPCDHCAIQATLHRLFALGPLLTPRVAAAPDLLSALTLAAPENGGPERIDVDAPPVSAEQARAFRRRALNRDQADLRSPALLGAGIAARLVGRVR